MSEKIYPKGIRTFKPNENAPDFVKGALIITPSELVKFCEENKHLMSDYNGTPQLRCQILDGDNGLYVNVDTWKKETSQNEVPPSKPQDDDQDFPF